MDPDLIKTADGSHTLKDIVTSENYHSVFGAINESLYVFIEQGLKNVNKPLLSIFEMGFGSGLNAFLSLLYSLEKGIRINYTALELFPLSNKTIIKLNYPDFYEIENSRRYFENLHFCNWNEEIEIVPTFSLRKLNDDIRTYKFNEVYDLIYYDAFSPSRQPELWSEEIFRNLSNFISPGGILVSYSSSGHVRRALQNAGLYVEKIKGPANKRHMLRGLKI